MRLWIKIRYGFKHATEDIGVPPYTIIYRQGTADAISRTPIFRCSYKHATEDIGVPPYTIIYIREGVADA